MVPVKLTDLCGRPLTRWTRIDPMAELDRFTDSVFGSLMGDRTCPSFKVDIREDENSYYVDADVPGLSKDEITVTFEGGTLTIAGERKVEESREEGHFVLNERRSGRFARSLTLPEGVKEDGIQAALEGGVLTVTLPKAAEAKQKRIKVTG